MEKAFQLHQQYMDMKQGFLKKITCSDDELSIHGSEGEPYTMDSECDLSVPNCSEEDEIEMIESDDDSTHTFLFEVDEKKPKKYIYECKDEGAARYIGTVYKVDKELEFERNTKHWSNRIWPYFVMKSVPKSLPNDINADIFFEYIDMILQNHSITTMDEPIHYLKRCGTDTDNHIFPAEFMSLLLCHEEFENVRILQTFRTFFPNTYHSEWKVMNYEKYYFYMDKIIEKYENIDGSNEDENEKFIEKYQFLNAIFIVYMFKNEISNQYYHFMGNQDESKSNISNYGYPYDLLVKMSYLIFYLYSKNIFLDRKSMIDLVIPISTFQ